MYVFVQIDRVREQADGVLFVFSLRKLHNLISYKQSKSEEEE